MWPAAIIGLSAGVLLSFSFARALVPGLIVRSRNRLLAAKCALGGGLIAILPAMLLALMAGAALGHHWGERLLQSVGLGPGGGVIGVALGVATVFTTVVLGGTLCGIGVARALGRVREPT